jgi:hypothetical protein
MASFYDIDRANARLVELIPLLEKLRDDRAAVARLQADLLRLRRSNGDEEHARETADQEAEVVRVVRRMEQAVAQIDGWSITLRDIGSGLVDFPALVSGRQVWLCWRLGEPAVEWWHEVSAGFDSRRPLIELA